MTPRPTPPPAFSEADAEALSLALNIIYDLAKAHDITIHADVWSTMTADVAFRKNLHNQPHHDNGPCVERSFAGGIRLYEQDLADMEQEAWDAAHKAREDREAAKEVQS